jgi:hypothetical protein
MAITVVSQLKGFLDVAGPICDMLDKSTTEDEILGRNSESFSIGWQSEHVSLNDLDVDCCGHKKLSYVIQMSTKRASVRAIGAQIHHPSDRKWYTLSARLHIEDRRSKVLCVERSHSKKAQDY